MAATDRHRPYDDLLRSVRTSIRYNTERRRFFDKWYRVTMFMGLIFASATTVALVQKITLTSGMSSIALGVSIATTLLFAFERTVGFQEKARDFNDLVKLFNRLEASMRQVERDEVKHEDIARWTAERLSIEDGERPVKRVLAVIAHNDEVMATDGLDKNNIYYIGPFARFFRHFAHGRQTFDTLAELEEAREAKRQKGRQERPNKTLPEATTV